MEPLRRSTAKDVILQLDTGNASEMEGVTMVDLIKRNPGRTVSMHVKPFSKKNPDAYLGADELDWPAIMKAGETVGGVEWYIIEYERGERSAARVAEGQLRQPQEAEKLASS